MAIVRNILEINSTATEIAVEDYYRFYNNKSYAYFKYSNSDIIDLSSLIDPSGVFTIIAEDLNMTRISDIVYFRVYI